MCNGLPASPRAFSRARHGGAGTWRHRRAGSMPLRHRPAARYLRPRRARLGGRNPRLWRSVRASRRTASPGSRPIAVRRAGDHGNKSSAATRCRTGFSQRPNAVGETGALGRYGSGRKPQFDTKAVCDNTRGKRAHGVQERVMSLTDVDYPPRFRTMSAWQRIAASCAAGGLAPRLPRLVAQHGARGRSRRRWSTCAQRLGRRKGWAKFDYVRNAGIPLGHPLGGAGGGPQYPVRPPFRRARLAGRAGRIPRHAAAAHRDPGRYRARLGRAAAPSRQDRAVAYDMRNLFQVNVEEGRHLWAMVYSAPQIFRPRRPR